MVSLADDALAADLAKIDLAAGGGDVGAEDETWQAFTPEEKQACYDVKQALLADPALQADADLDDRFIVVTALTCKMRVDSAVEKYKTFVEALAVYGLRVAQLDEPAAWDQSVPYMNRSYRVCGKDRDGRNVMWISGSKEGIQPKDEALQVRGGVLMWLAIHSSLHPLREGITFVIDTSQTPLKPVGNEKKLQRTWQVRDRASERASERAREFAHTRMHARMLRF